MKIILVATDFTEHSARALDFAVDIGEKVGGARVYLLHAFTIPVIAPPAGSGVTQTDLSGRIVHAAQEALARQVDSMKGRGVEICSLLQEGDPRTLIPTVAEDVRADFIVMGTHGRQGVVRALLGSVAESILRTAEIPVVTVRAPEG